MEETKNDVLLTDGQHRPKAVQTVVAVLFVVQALLSMFGASLLLALGQSMELSYLISDGGYALLAVCWAMLAMHANNKATRLAMLIMAGANIVFVFLLFLNFQQIIVGDVINVISVIWLLAILYSLSLVMTNAQLSKNNKKWVNVVAAINCISLSFNTVNIFVGDYLSMLFKGDNFLAHNYFSAGYLNYWVLVSGVLHVIGLCKLARSEAFGGKYDETAEPNFSPFNRWMAAAFVVPSIVTLAIYLLYANSNLFI